MLLTDFVVQLLARSSVIYSVSLLALFGWNELGTVLLMDIQLDQLQLMLISMFREDVRILCLVP